MTREKAIDLLNLYSIDELGEAKLDTWYHGIDEHMREALGMAIEALSADRPTGWIPVSDIRKLQDILYLHIDSLEGTRNIVEAGMLSA